MMSETATDRVSDTGSPDASGSPAPVARPGLLRAALLRLHRFLLPNDEFVGWTPYVWLIYLTLFVIPIFLPQVEPWQKVATAAGLIVFLFLYFAGFRSSGRQMMVIIAAITLLAVLTVPFNWGGVAFFIYAAAFGGTLAPPRRAAMVILAIVAVVLLQSFLLDLPPQIWVVGSVFGALIGFVNMHQVENARKNSALKLSQAEIRRLGAIAERERIARDLHDLLGHSLSVIAIKSELASKLAARNDERFRQEIDEVSSIARSALSEVRSAVSGYRSPSIAVELASARLALAALDIDLHVESETLDLPLEVEAVMALAIRESVTNILRHSGATSCRVSLERHGENVALEISDDGRGATGEEGSGLSGMRERISTAGGTMSISGAGGTRIGIIIPLKSRVDA